MPFSALEKPSHSQLPRASLSRVPILIWSGLLFHGRNHFLGAHLGSSGLALDLALTGVGINLASIAVQALLITPPLDLQQAHVESVNQRLIHQVVRLQRANGVATKTAFENVDSPEFLALLQNFGDTAKVVIPAAVGFRPLDTVPLQQMIGHQIALLV